MAGNPRRHALLGVIAEICVLRRLGGGRDGDRTCDPLPVRGAKLRPKRFPTMVVSHAIAALEARHETKLFDRIGRRIALTEAGRVFLMEARAILAVAGDRLARLHAKCASLHGPKFSAPHPSAGGTFMRCPA